MRDEQKQEIASNITALQASHKHYPQSMLLSANKLLENEKHCLWNLIVSLHNNL